MSLADSRQRMTYHLPINSTTYQTILELYSRDFLPNTLLILDELRKRSDYADNEKLYIEVVLEIEQSAFTTAYFESQVQVIKDKSVRRQLILFSERLSRDANNPQSNCDKLLSNAESVIHSVGGEPTIAKFPVSTCTSSGRH